MRAVSRAPTLAEHGSGIRRWFADAGRIVLAFAFARVVLLLLVYMTRLEIPERARNHHKSFVAFPNSKVLDSFARWDSGWYWRIVENGYPVEPRHEHAFFPGFPLVTELAAKLTGDVWSAGLLVSNLAALGAMGFMLGIARRYYDERKSWLVVWFVIAFPTAFFFSVFYSEALFFFAVSGAFYCYERDRLVPAGLFSALAVLTRPVGIMLFPALLFGVLHRRGWKIRSVPIGTLSLLLGPLALAAYMLYLHQRTGDAFAFANVQSLWGRSSEFPLVTLFKEARHLPNSGLETMRMVDIPATLLLFAVAALSLRTLDSAHSIYALLAVLVPLASGSLFSMVRFASCVVPLYLVFARLAARDGVVLGLLYAFSMLQALHAVLFASWFWSG